MRSYLTIFGLLVCNIGAAADVDPAAAHPLLGMVYNTKEWSALSYECSLVNSGLLSCDFTQMGIRRKTKPEEMEKRVAEAMREKPTAVLDEELCKNSTRYLDAVAGKIQMPSEFKFESTPKKRADTLRLMSAMRDYCATPNVANLEKLARAGGEPDTRTCVMSSHRFTQSFALVSDDLTKKKTWVVKAKPEGPCGTVQLDRFEPSKPYSGKLTWWSYIARKAVTNPAGTIMGTMKCDALDEQTYRYTWDVNEAGTREVSCDYIEFSPL